MTNPHDDNRDAVDHPSAVKLAIKVWTSLDFDDEAKAMAREILARNGLETTPSHALQNHVEAPQSSVCREAGQNGDLRTATSVASTPSATLCMTTIERQHLADWHERLATIMDQSDDFNGAAFHQGRAKELRRPDGSAQT